MKTLIEFINEKQADFTYASGEFSRLLNDIGIAAGRPYGNRWQLPAIRHDADRRGTAG